MVTEGKLTALVLVMQFLSRNNFYTLIDDHR